MAWQPIETAPRDGTSVLLCEADSGYVDIGYWRTDRPASGGFWDDGQMELGVDKPTHWAPIPPLPEVLP